MSIELKQAAQQAIEAFDAFGDADDFATIFALTQKMNALRTALQQAESEPVGEPRARVELMKTGGNVGLSTRIIELDIATRERLRPGDLLYTHPAPAASVSDERKAFEAWYFENVNRAELPDYLPTLETYSSATVANLFCAWKARAAMRPAQAGDQWREAVEDWFVIDNTDMPEDPREAIKKLIANEVRDALDPTISSAAAALAQAGVPDDIVKDAERYRWLKAYDQNSEDMGICKWVDEGWSGQWVIEHDPDTSIDAAMLAASPAQKGGE